MKKAIILLLICMLSTHITTNAQEVAYDYFYKSIYDYTINDINITGRYAIFDKYLTEGQSQEKENIILINNQNILKDQYEVNTRPSYMSPDWQEMSMTEHQLRYTDDVIYSEKQTVTNPFFPKGSIRKDLIYLVALPLESGPRTWNETQNETKYDCKAEWAYICYANNYYARVIKITKTSKNYGKTYIEKYYWAKGFGLVWQTVTIDEEKTVLKRDDFVSITEISEKEYANAIAWAIFKNERQKIIKSIEKEAPNIYSDIVDEFSKEVLNLNNDYITYPTGHPSSIGGWENPSVQLRSFSMKYELEITITDGIINIDSDNRFYIKDWGIGYCGEEPNDINMINFINGRIKDGTLVLPYDVEPSSNNKYIYTTKDTLSVLVNVDCYPLKAKKGKKGYQLAKGDKNIWNSCFQMIDFDSLFENNKSTATFRIIKYSCNGYSCYLLIKKAKMKTGSTYEEDMRCDLIRLVD